MPDPIPVYVHLRRAKDLMDREYARELDLEGLAREAHASRAHFARGFKKAFGETPHQYLLRRRLERAKDRLRNTGLSVTEVSIEVGFRSLGSFSAAFRELVGEPPSAYAATRRGAAPVAHFFGDEALTPREVVEANRSTEVWNRGCPVAVLGPGTLLDFGEALREPVGRIHWAGTETSTYWAGYMDGAVRSGRRAAAEVLAGL